MFGRAIRQKVDRVMLCINNLFCKLSGKLLSKNEIFCLFLLELFMISYNARIKIPTFLKVENCFEIPLFFIYSHFLIGCFYVISTYNCA